MEKDRGEIEACCAPLPYEHNNVDNVYILYINVALLSLRDAERFLSYHAELQT